MGKKYKRCPFDGCNEKIAPNVTLIGMCNKCNLCFCVAHRLPKLINAHVKDAEQIKKENEIKKKKADELRCVANKI